MITKFQSEVRRDEYVAWSHAALDFGNVNLLVGQNACGKSRLLNAVRNFAKLFSRQRVPNYGGWDVELSVPNVGTYRVLLQVRNNTVTKERVELNGDILIVREEDSNRGKIRTFTDEKTSELISFELPKGTPACVSKRDLLQYPYLEHLISWAKNARYLPFGTPLGNRQAFIPPDENVATSSFEEKVFEKDDLFEHTPELFKIGIARYGDEFADFVSQLMRRIGYPVEYISVGPVANAQVPPNLRGVPEAFTVREAGIVPDIMQHEISQGMWRCIALCVYLALARYSDDQHTLIIDDVGEGLDFQRGENLISVLLQAANDWGVQLVMASNDYYVLNNVPIEGWIILQRSNGAVETYTAKNSQQRFAEFQALGLRNTDFLRMNMFH